MATKKTASKKTAPKALTLKDLDMLHSRIDYQNTLLDALRQDTNTAVSRVKQAQDNHVKDHLRWLEERAEDLSRLEKAVAEIEASPAPKKHPSQMNAAELREYVQSPDAQIAGLQEKINYLNKLTWGPNSHESRLQLLEKQFADLSTYCDTIKKLSTSALKHEQQEHEQQEQEKYLAHEALDRTCMVQEIVDSQLLEHPWILADGEVLDLVDKASTALAKAYQMIGQKTL